MFLFNLAKLLLYSKTMKFQYPTFRYIKAQKYCILAKCKPICKCIEEQRIKNNSHPPGSQVVR